MSSTTTTESPSTQLPPIDTELRTQEIETIPSIPSDATSKIDNVNNPTSQNSNSEPEAEPDTPTSSTDSSNSFTTVTADISSSAVIVDRPSSSDVLAELDISSRRSSSGSIHVPSVEVVSPGGTGAIASSSNTTLETPRPPRSLGRSVKPRKASLTHPEQGWDDGTVSDGNVFEYKTEQEVSRRVTYTEKKVIESMSMAYEGNWMFSKVFSEGAYMASGFVHILPRGRKGTKNVKDNTYIFFVIEGAVNVKIHNTAYILSPGGSFTVPRGNTYSIENISERTAKLMFAQAREVTVGEQEDPIRLVRGQQTRYLPAALPTSKVVILLGWIFERLLKRFVKYRKVVLAWYLKSAMLVARHVKGPRAYLAFFVLGFLFRSLTPSKGLLPKINIQFIAPEK